MKLNDDLFSFDREAIVDDLVTLEADVLEFLSITLHSGNETGALIPTVVFTKIMTHAKNDRSDSIVFCVALLP